MLRTGLGILVIMASVSVSAWGQWDPNNGLWGKEVETDLRVMTWNIRDGVVSTSNRKHDGFVDWNALVHIVAALRPDVLLIQEAGDRSGNGTGSGVDSVGELTATFGLFMYGGPDPFQGGQEVTSYVQRWAPDYDLPYVFVSSATDQFNRNAILSRYPIADINGDGLSAFSNFVLLPDAYQSGGNGGIRDFMHVEIDLPDDVYKGDVVVGNMHLKAGGTSSDLADRVRAAQNIAYFIDYFFNGAGTGVVDPNDKIAFPATTPTVLDPNTPVIVGGDLNENEATNGRKGPADWIARAQLTGGTDGTDRDRTDSTYDAATHPISGEIGTFSATNKLDYIIWQDSIATARRQFTFASFTTGMTIDKLPLPVRNFPIQPLSTSGIASDHRPVIIDFILPLVEIVECIADWNGDGELNFFDVALFLADFSAHDPRADLNGDGELNFFDVSIYLAAFSAGCP